MIIDPRELAAAIADVLADEEYMTMARDWAWSDVGETPPPSGWPAAIPQDLAVAAMAASRVAERIVAAERTEPEANDEPEPAPRVDHAARLRALLDDEVARLTSTATERAS